MIIARDHNHTGDAEGAQRRQCRLGGSPRRVHQPDDPQIHLAASHDHRRPPARTEPFDCGHRFIGQCGDAVLAEHLGLADRYRIALQRRADAAAGQAFQIARLWQRGVVQACPAVLDDRRGERVIAQGLHGDGRREQPVLGDARHRDDIGDFGLAFC